MKKEIYSWKAFNIDISCICYKIKTDMKDIKAIYAIPKGGLPLGVALANHLKLPFYLDLRDIPFSRAKTLIVDDTSDSGKTFINIPNVCDYKTISLYIKEGTQFIPNFFIRECKKHRWIVFPWEPLSKEAKKDGTIKNSN